MECRAIQVLLVEKEKRVYLGLMGPKGPQAMMHKVLLVLWVHKV